MSHFVKMKQLITKAMNSSIERSDTRYALDRSKTYWRLPVADRSPPMSRTLYYFDPTEDDRSPAPQKFKTMYDVLVNHAPVPPDFAPPPRAPGRPLRTRNDAFTKPYVDACDVATSARSTFTTRCGFVGLGPPDIQQGDAVAILLGADVPFILRRQGDHYTLVGDCYVHGIMQGELIDILERNGWKLHGPTLEEFKIR